MNGFTRGRGEQNAAGELREAHRLNGQSVGLVIRDVGATLTCELFPERPSNTGEVEELTSHFSFFLGLDEELSAFNAWAAEDVVFRVVLEALHGFHQPRFLTPFEATCWAILSQRLPMPQAWKLKRELSLRGGGDWEGLPAFPKPAVVAGLSPAQLSVTVPDGGPRTGRTGEGVCWPIARVKAWLIALYGVGEWSALFVLQRGLGRVESVLEQPDDRRPTRELLKVARPVYGELTPPQLWERARWSGAQQRQRAMFLRSRAALMGQKEST